MSVHILEGDAMRRLKELPDQSVNCIVTSPPYLGLRAYMPVDHPDKRREIGCDQSPKAYVASLVKVFREAWRVLRDDGVMFVNLGDSYAGGGRGGAATTESSTLQGSKGYQAHAVRTAKEVSNFQRQNCPPAKGSRLPAGFHERARQGGAIGRAWVKPAEGLKHKDLMFMPHRVAIALLEDGWCSRSDIVWSKPNSMPGSQRDRPTRSHEYVFMFTKSNSPKIWRARDTGEWSTKPAKKERLPHPEIAGKTVSRWMEFDYFWDAEAIEEPLAPASIARLSQINRATQAGSDRVPGKHNGPMRAVASPQNLQRLALARDRYRLVGDEDDGPPPTRTKRSVWTIATTQFKESHFATFPVLLPETCIKAACPVGGVVLDIFGGAGTTALAADRLLRHAVIFELNPESVEIANQRLLGDLPLFSDVTVWNKKQAAPWAGRSALQFAGSTAVIDFNRKAVPERAKPRRAAARAADLLDKAA